VIDSVFALRHEEERVFIGHLALGFAAKRAAPELPLGLAFLASELPDAIWPVLVMTGVEHVSIAPGDTAVTPLRFDSYPISHSLLTVAVWGVLLALAWRARRGSRRGAWLIGLLAVSHWVLDAVSHRPDLPLVPWGTTRVGLGLWNSLSGTLIVEPALLAVGVGLFATRPQARPGAGRVALAGLVLALVALYLANIFGPPPPGIAAVAVVGLLAIPLLWVWGNWVDRRTSRGAPAAA